VTLSANDQMQSADDYRQLIIAYQNGAPIRLAMSPPSNKGRKTAGWAHGPTSSRRS
jgi:hypothetical protein